MRNQTSFRLTTTLLPTDLTAKTTQVINKVDANWDKFYPTFTEETVVITNDDRTIMETTKATCTAWVLTFVKRGLSDDDSETQVTNRKLTRNPWSLCFITAWASDLLDKDDDIVWWWKQIYTDDMESRGKATYKGRLITEKWVEYPHFDSLEDLQDYSSPFGWMFAVVDSDWELYKYNAVDEEWSVVTTSTPVQPAKASTSAIGTVRVATDAEFEAGTDTGSQWEYLVATTSQILWVSPDVDTKIFDLTGTSDTTWWQAILDFCLEDKCPIIKYIDWSSYLFYYLNKKTSSYYEFYHTRPSFWNYNSQYYVEWEKLRIRYSGTSLTEISVSTDRAYINGYE